MMQYLHGDNAKQGLFILAMTALMIAWSFHLQSVE